LNRQQYPRCAIRTSNSEAISSDSDADSEKNVDKGVVQEWHPQDDERHFRYELRQQVGQGRFGEVTTKSVCSLSKLNNKDKKGLESNNDQRRKSSQQTSFFRCETNVC
jgi:hypothetical protein